MSVVESVPQNKVSEWKDGEWQQKPPAIRSHSDRDDGEPPEPSFIYIGEYADKTAYYSPARDKVMLREVHSDEFTEEVFLSEDDTDVRGLEEHIVHFVEAARAKGVDFQLSKQAYALCAGGEAANIVLSENQAKVYAMRDIFDIGTV